MVGVRCRLVSVPQNKAASAVVQVLRHVETVVHQMGFLLVYMSRTTHWLLIVYLLENEVAITSLCHINNYLRDKKGL